MPATEAGPYGTCDVVESGSAAEPHFAVKVPGIVGPKGDNARIQEALDFDNSVPPQDGQGIVYDATKEKARWGDLSPYGVGMISLPENQFTAGSYSGRQVIATLPAPGQPVAWYPDVSGIVRWSRPLLSTAQVQIEVRWEFDGVNSPETGNLCGLAAYDPSILDAEVVAAIDAHFSDATDVGRAVGPDSAAGRVPADQAITMTVQAVKSGGSGNYQIKQKDAQLVCRIYPV